jgi:hypothetical protein
MLFIVAYQKYRVFIKTVDMIIVAYMMVAI